MLVKGWFLTNCSRPLCGGELVKNKQIFLLELGTKSRTNTRTITHSRRMVNAVHITAEDRRRCNCQSCGESFAFGQVNHRHEYESISRIKIRSTSNLH